MPKFQFIEPGSVLRRLSEHPDWSALPITELAPQFGTSRLIFVELATFEYQPPGFIGLLKGTGVANLRVVEMAGGQAKVAFEEMGIKANYPSSSPEGVSATASMNARTVYEGTLTKLADKLAVRFDEKP